MEVVEVEQISIIDLVYLLCPFTIKGRDIVGSRYILQIKLVTETSSTSTSYSQQSISDYYWEALSGTAIKMMKMGDVKAKMK